MTRLANSTRSAPNYKPWQILWLLPQVEALAKKVRWQISFLPAQAYLAALERGRLLTLTHDNEVLGFCMFGVRREVARIHQLAVRPDARRRINATDLLCAIAAAPGAANVRTLRARVAADLEANLFWTSLGFLPTSSQTHSPRHTRLLLNYERPTTCQLYVTSTCGSSESSSEAGSAVTSDLSHFTRRAAENLCGILAAHQLLAPAQPRHANAIASAWQSVAGTNSTNQQKTLGINLL